jgi:raffinose/stachyose/melibiose transport system substrate-binding protein
MKKTFAVLLALLMCAGVLAGCGTPATSGSDGGTGATTPNGDGVQLTVVTSYGQEDGNRANFVEAMEKWKAETGNDVLENSATSDETWKAQVLTDGEAGADPDVLFFFTGADADPLIEGDKVVSIEEIRTEYSDYANNMVQDMMPAATNGELYAIPTIGYWEGIFYNKTVLEAAGVEAPTADTTWEKFLEMCDKIKEAGYTPIAIGSDVPHYWFEFLILNAGGIDNHLNLPTADNAAHDSWIEGLDGFREMYSRGYFPDDYLTMNNEEAKALVADGDAAFIGEGSWTVGWFATNADVNEIGVTYAPGTEKSSATEIITGVSMGYYITRKAWDDPAKREAAVSFVQYMTNNEVVGQMTATASASNILSSPSDAEISFDDLLHETAYNMVNGATGKVAAVQDIAAGPARETLFTSDIPQIATGNMTSEEAVDKWIEAFGA